MSVTRNQRDGCYFRCGGLSRSGQEQMPCTGSLVLFCVPQSPCVTTRLVPPGLAPGSGAAGPTAVGPLAGLREGLDQPNPLSWKCVTARGLGSPCGPCVREGRAGWEHSGREMWRYWREMDKDRDTQKQTRKERRSGPGQTAPLAQEFLPFPAPAHQGTSNQAPYCLSS